MLISYACMLLTCNSVVDMLVMWLVLGPSLMVISITSILVIVYYLTMVVCMSIKFCATLYPISTVAMVTLC